MTKPARVALVGGTVLVAMLAVGCGAAGPSGGGTAQNSGASAKQRDGAKMREFAACMRQQGVDMPDDGSISIDNKDDKERQAKVDLAFEKCRRHLPDGGEPPKLNPQEIEQMRKYAKCMRENGIDYFPDPDADGGKPFATDQSLARRLKSDPKRSAAEQKCNNGQSGFVVKSGGKA